MIALTASPHTSKQLEWTPLTTKRTSLISDRFSEPKKQAEVLKAVMTNFQTKVFEMLKNHGTIVWNEGNLIEKLKEYEENVNRVREKLAEGQKGTTNT